MLSASSSNKGVWLYHVISRWIISGGNMNSPHSLDLQRMKLSLSYIQFFMLTNLLKTNGHWAPSGQCIFIVLCIISTICRTFFGKINFLLHHGACISVCRITTWIWLRTQDASLQLSAFDARSSCHLFRYKFVTERWGSFLFCESEIFTGGKGGGDQSSHAAKTHFKGQGKENNLPIHKEIKRWSDSKAPRCFHLPEGRRKLGKNQL